MKTLKRFDVLSVAKFQAVMMAAIYFIFALIGTAIAKIFGGMAGSMMMNQGMQMQAQGMQSAMTGGSIMALILAPVFGAVAGFIGGAIVAFVYNVVAKVIGGIKLDLE